MARYQGLLLSTSHRFSNHFSSNFNFTDSYCLSDYDFGAALAGSTNSQLFNRHADWGPCISDTRYNFNASRRGAELVEGRQCVGQPVAERLETRAHPNRAQRPAPERHRLAPTIR